MHHAKDLSPRSRRIPVVAAIALFGLFTVALLPATPGLASPLCSLPDNGAGSADLPPVGCAYDGAGNVFKIIDGLPVGTELHSVCLWQDFVGILRAPGGPLGGEVENYQATMPWNMAGTGTLLGYNRSLAMQITCETHTAPRVPGQPVQSFDTDMFRIQGQLPIGDPDFDLLRISAGTGFNMPSPGHTTLTTVPGPVWNVDSFFDIEYRIDFIGAPGGPLAGRSGSTTATIRMQTGQPVNPTKTAASTWGKIKLIYR